MCMEDIRIGKKKYTRKTALAAGVFTTFPADARRILLRAIPNRDLVRVWSENVNDDPPIIFLSATNPADEITLERHGNVVFGAFVAVATTNAGGIFEVFLDDTENPPKKID